MVLRLTNVHVHVICLSAIHVNCWHVVQPYEDNNTKAKPLHLLYTRDGKKTSIIRLFDFFFCDLYFILGGSTILRQSSIGAGGCDVLECH